MLEMNCLFRPKRLINKHSGWRPAGKGFIEQAGLFVSHIAPGREPDGLVMERVPERDPLLFFCPLAIL